MGTLVFGLVLFLGVHGLTAWRGLRTALRKRLGEVQYKWVYSALSLVGIVLVVLGYGEYRSAGYIDVWTPPHSFRFVAMALMLPVFPLLAAAYLPCGLRRLVRHPMLVGVKLWASAHLLANGDLGSILLFGSFLGWAIFARISLRKRDLEEVTPDLSAMRFGRIDLAAIVAGLTAFVIVAHYLHPILIGVMVEPG